MSAETTPINERLETELAEAERRAWDSLSRYKFWQFGYWCAIWVHLNRIGDLGRNNPWRELVHAAVMHKAAQSGGDNGTSSIQSQ